MPTKRGSGYSLTRSYNYGADLRDRLGGLAVTVLLWLVCAAVGALFAWCIMCPDYEPVSKAEWEAICAEQMGANQ